MSDEIVCTARRETRPDGTVSLTFSMGTGIPGVRFFTQNTISEDGSDQEVEVLLVAVRVKKTKQTSDLARMQQADLAVVSVLIRVITAMEITNFAGSVTIHGTVITVIDLYNTLMNTQFEITDKDYTSLNLGVGAANRGTNGGPNLDEINYESILNNYHNPNFAGDPGLTALILHEIGHLSQQGADFLATSRSIFQNDPTMASSSFFGSPYGNNLENYANDIATDISNLIGINLFGSRPGGYTAPSRTPEGIYQSNNNTAYPH